MESTIDSRAAIQSIVPLVFDLLRPLKELKFLVEVHLQSMYRQMSAFRNKDEEALDELQKQIQMLGQ
jgi:hypothetical protein